MLVRGVVFGGVLALAGCGDGDGESAGGTSFGPGGGPGGQESGADDTQGGGDDDDGGPGEEGGSDPGPSSTAPATTNGEESGGEEGGSTSDDTGPGSGDGISPDYPGDVGIDGHPSVIFFENFEDPDIPTLTSAWDNATMPEALSLSGEVPNGAVAGSQSLTMSVQSGGGVTLYQTVPDQELVYVRYYARYNEQSQYHHTGMWLGGYNPSTPWPQGNAGLLPSGSNFFHNTFEPAGGGGPLSFDHYAYWPGMQCLQQPNQCWGNHLLGSQQESIPADEWVCFELMMKMNEPGGSDGEWAIWMNDELVQHVEPGTTLSSNGVGGWEPDPAGEAFPGFNWRSTGDFGMNFLWLDFYTDGASSMDWDQVVVATERVGCMAPA